MLYTANALPSPVSFQWKNQPKNQHNYQYLHFYEWMKIHLNITFFSILVWISFFFFLCAIQKSDTGNKNTSALKTCVPGTLFIHRKPLLPPSSIMYFAAYQMSWTPVGWRNSIPILGLYFLLKVGVRGWHTGNMLLALKILREIGIRHQLITCNILSLTSNYNISSCLVVPDPVQISCIQTHWLSRCGTYT